MLPIGQFTPKVWKNYQAAASATESDSKSETESDSDLGHYPDPDPDGSNLASMPWTAAKPAKPAKTGVDGKSVKFKLDLQECLDDVQYDGHTSSYHSFTKYVNPGLHVANYRPVGLPLTVCDAKAIARICKPSPFGKGSQTLVNTSVRKT